MSVFDNGPNILDVTLRDGSYLIDFQFTAQDTAMIASALESVGSDGSNAVTGLGSMRQQAAGALQRRLTRNTLTWPRRR